tara:strand:- start:1595 stop:2101 length:507 start_codon:yes stop_codon:yes gene_type:complete
MATISNPFATHGLKADGTAASTNASVSGTIGLNQIKSTLTGTDVFYSLSITSTGASDVATLDLTDGIVTQTTGTPTIADGDGKDFEGTTLATLVSISAIYVTFDEHAAGVIAMACADVSLPDITSSQDGAVAMMIQASGKTLSGDTIAFTFSDAASQKVTVIVAGKTT